MASEGGGNGGYRDERDEVVLDYESDNDRQSGRPSNDRQQQEGGHGYGLYITNLSHEVTDEQLRSAFEVHGAVIQAAVVKQPITKLSRGFGFVVMANAEDGERALEAMQGFDLSGRPMRVEKSKRTAAYDKTPGVYLGPEKARLSTVDSKPRNGGRDERRGGGMGDRPNRSRDRGDFRGFDRDRGGGRRDRSRSRSRSRGREYDRGREPRPNSRDRGGGRGGDYPPYDRYYRGPPQPPIASLLDRYPLESRFEQRGGRFEERGGRAMPLPPPSHHPAAPMPYRSRSPPRYDSRRERSPPPYDRFGDAPPGPGYYRGGPPPRY